MAHGQHISSYDEKAEADTPWAASFAKRNFDPFQIFGPGVDLSMMERPIYGNSGYIWNHSVCYHSKLCEHCNDYSAHTDSLVIAVDGNHLPDGQSSCGVYVGQGNMYNERVYIPESAKEPITLQSSELQAGIQGLIIAIKIRTLEDFSEDETPLSLVIIKANSDCLVKGMTERIVKWKKNGYKTARGTPVMYSSLFRTLDTLAETLEKLGVKVLFWQVSRELNLEADKIAKNGVQKAYYAVDDNDSYNGSGES